MAATGSRAQEEQAHRRFAYDALTERDKLAAELAEVYPPLAAKLADLAARVAANDAEIERVNQKLPGGAKWMPKRRGRRRFGSSCPVSLENRWDNVKNTLWKTMGDERKVGQDKQLKGRDCFSPLLGTRFAASPVREPS